MGYSIEDLKGHLYLVDGGRNEDASYVRHVITTHANRVNAWFLTHPHTDHVNAFSSILESSYQLPRIDAIYASQFDAERYKKTAVPEDVYSDYVRMNNAISSTGLEERVHYLHKGDSIALYGLSVKCFHDYTSKVGGNACNDGSLMFKISGKKKSMLFCGDIQASQTDVITKEFGQELSCNYIQMSHHGNSGLGAAFYKQAASKGNLELAFFDAPEWLFHPAKGTNFTTEETRKLMKSLGARNVYFKTAPNSVLLQ
jgi:beta-lactamase superfamily II metal-dependent hydrolase